MDKIFKLKLTVYNLLLIFLISLSFAFQHYRHLVREHVHILPFLRNNYLFFL